MTYEPKEREILDQVVAALHGYYGERLRRVVLFGSRGTKLGDLCVSPEGCWSVAGGQASVTSDTPGSCASTMHPGWGGGAAPHRSAFATIPAPLPGCAAHRPQTGGIARYARSTPGYGPSALRAAYSNVFILKLDHVLLQKPDVFVAECQDAVMLVLLLNVCADSRNLGAAHGECAISVLPIERAFADGVVNPLGRFVFHVAHDFADLMGRFQADKHVNVVGYTADFRWHAAERIDAAAKKGLETILPFRDDEWATIFGTENEVVIERVMRGRHRSIFPRPVRRASRNLMRCSVDERLHHPVRGASHAARDPGVSLVTLAQPPATVRQPSGLARQLRSDDHFADVRKMVLANQPAHLSSTN